MIETILIGLLFVGAIAYVGRQVYSNFNASKKGCNKGCGCKGEG